MSGITFTPPRAWLATFVQRWHVNPVLGRSGDATGWHSARMAVLALHFWPDASAALLRACIVHDLPEHEAGDVPYTAKADPHLRAALEAVERRAATEMGMEMPALDETDARRLRFLDRLDAAMWMQHHAPQLAAQESWRADLADIRAMADELLMAPESPQ